MIRLHTISREELIADINLDSETACEHAAHARFLLERIELYDDQWHREYLVERVKASQDLASFFYACAMGGREYLINNSSTVISTLTTC